MVVRRDPTGLLYGNPERRNICHDMIRRLYHEYGIGRHCSGLEGGHGNCGRRISAQWLKYESAELQPILLKSVGYEELLILTAHDDW